MERRQRLAKLLTLQRHVEELHKARHAAFLKEAASAQNEAVEMAARLQATDSLASLFPDLYHRRIAQALIRQTDYEEKAAQEARKVAAANARANVVERNYRDVMRKHERSAEEKALLELVEQRLKYESSE
ncbi:hypothetical protein [Chelativorans sp. Marseille-P2723]|uniref:hypothetical protein n=1 Tax=Chelativorans sp. Marseille-P2723 TaxID=2709133 RepID=UPI0015713E54|nr:hypothetical protein [Chelativorans sp. Marseille-P2723]